MAGVTMPLWLVWLIRRGPDECGWSGAWGLRGSDGVKEEGSGIMLCCCLRNIKAVGCVWSLPAFPPGCHWGGGVDADLHVQFLEPDRTAFQFSWPWRKQIRKDRKQLQLTWQAEMNAASWSNVVITRILMESPLWLNIWELWNMICFHVLTSLPIVFPLPADFSFICSVIQKYIFFGEKI